MITEMVDGLIITRPAKKFQEITEAKMAKKIAISEPELIDLQEHVKSKTGSVSNQGINKLKVINDFIRSNGRI